MGLGDTEARLIRQSRGAVSSGYFIQGSYLLVQMAASTQQIATKAAFAIETDRAGPTLLRCASHANISGPALLTELYENTLQ
jgi:hypothetical protein